MCSLIRTTWRIERRVRSVLVDEDLSPRLSSALAAELGEDVRCSSVRREGWSGLNNGALRARMTQHGFTILVTADRNIARQQPLTRRGSGGTAARA